MKIYKLYVNNKNKMFCKLTKINQAINLKIKFFKNYEK